jgi:dipeptidyl-peptidase-4
MVKTRIFFFLFIIFGNSYSQSLSIEKIWKENAFRAKSVEGFKSMKDGIHYTRLNEVNKIQNITKYSITKSNDQGTVLIPSEKLKYQGKKITVEEYYFNEDESKVLLITESTPVYRRSYLAVHYLYDLQSGLLEPLDETHQPQTLAEYSPDGMKVSYIYEKNIYVKDLSNHSIKQLTQDGKQNELNNGSTDWVYEEEFSITKAYDWSPDSRFIGYLKFNEKYVKEYQLTYFGELYPTKYTYKYPKAGEANSKVSAHILNIKSGRSTTVDLGEYEYIPRIDWSTSSNKLILQTLNREQNHLKYHLIDVTGKKPIHHMFFEEVSNTYIDIDNNLFILSEGNMILRTSEASGFNHIYKLTFDGQMTQLTKGQWDVIDFYGIDEKEGQIYYSAAEKNAITKDICCISLDGKVKSSLSSETGYNDAQFTSGMKYFIKTYSNANTPPTYTLCTNKGKEISVLEDNKTLLNQLRNFNLSKKEFLTFNTGECLLNGWMIKPSNFNPQNKYPVYITIYGGPGHNEVTDSWDANDYMYHQLLAQKGYLVVSVDPRGTMYRGASFKKSTYLQLGKLETEDIISVAKELQTFAFVDPQRIGIQGWSYGGFLTSLAMTKGADYFKMGIAIAPVTNWRYYDNIYTERFMRTPNENNKGYDDNSPINFVEQLKGNYFLIHGASDDNVHEQNTMEMINALVRTNKQFDLFIYPNRNHGIYGGNTRNHLFTMLLEYTLKNL